MSIAQLFPIIDCMTAETTPSELFDKIGDITIAGAIYEAFGRGLNVGRKEITKQIS